MSDELCTGPRKGIFRRNDTVCGQIVMADPKGKPAMPLFALPQFASCSREINFMHPKRGRPGKLI